MTKPHSELPQPELSSEHVALLRTANVLLESSLARRETRYGKRDLTRRERIAYYAGRLVGARPSAGYDDAPGEIARSILLHKVHMQTDHARVYVGWDQQNGHKLYLEKNVTTNFDTNETAERLELVGERDAVNQSAATDYSAHITEVVSRKSLETLSLEEVAAVQGYFDQRLTQIDPAK